MTIYVDNMRGDARVDRGGRAVRGQWSHLLADDAGELAAFAAGLGLRPEWLQSPGTPGEHYDIVEGVRRRAVAAGAVPISYPRGTGNVIATKQLQAAALDAASRAWHVFPLRPGTKVPAVRQWEHEATTDAEQIKELWSADLRRHDGWYMPEPRNVGIACGPSDLVVLDLDLAKPGQDRTSWEERWRDRGVSSGVDVLAALAEQAGENVPETYVVATPSGGRHLYFATPDGMAVRNSAGHLGPMVDVRGAGGYVVAAGSRLHPDPDRDGASAETGELGYRLVHDLQPVPLPGWVADATSAGRQRDGDQAAAPGSSRSPRDQPLSSPGDGYGAAALRGESDRVRSAPVGRRNHTLNAAAYSLGQLVAAGAVHQDRAVAALSDAAADAGLEASEIASTIASGLSAGLQRPRALPEVRRAPVQAEEPVGSERRGEAADGVDQAQNLGQPAGVTPEPSDRPAHQPGRGVRRAGLEPVSVQEPLTTGQGDTSDPAISEHLEMARPSGASDERADPPYVIYEVDAAHAGWLFAEAWDSFATDRRPCYPPDTLRAACEGERLPTLGKSDRRFAPRPRAAFIEAPGEELVHRDVWYSWSQSQRDECDSARHERARAAATDAPRHQSVDSTSIREATLAQGSAAVGVKEAANAEYLPDESALEQPANADALVRALLAVLQSKGTIDRAAWDATVAATAEQSAAASRDDVAGARRSDPQVPVAETSDEALNARDVSATGSARSAPASTFGWPAFPDEADPADAGPPNHVKNGLTPDRPHVAALAQQEPPPDESQPPESLKPEKPQADVPEPSDPHLVLGESIEQARAAVAHLGAIRAAGRHQSRDETPDIGVHDDRPAYWTEPEVEL